MLLSCWWLGWQLFSEAWGGQSSAHSNWVTVVALDVQKILNTPLSTCNVHVSLCGLCSHRWPFEISRDEMKRNFATYCSSCNVSAKGGIKFTFSPFLLFSRLSFLVLTSPSHLIVSRSLFSQVTYFFFALGDTRNMKNKQALLLHHY